MTPDHATKGPASAGPFRVLLAALVLLGGVACKARGGPHDSSAKGPGFDESKAAHPAPLDPSVPGATSSTTDGPGARTSSTLRGRATSSTARPGATTSTAAAAPFHTVLSLADRTGDQALPASQTRPFADLVEVRVEDNGLSARFTVTVAGDFPTTVGSGETADVAVDIDRTPEDHDWDYQLYALIDEAHGWRAFYSDARGQQEFPGTFEMGGAKAVFVVPWAALGGKTRSALDSFAEWTGSGTVITPANEDHAPDNGTTPLAP